MRWRRIASWTAFGALALIVLALGWLWTADLAVFKPQLERFVTQQTGRAFAIDGEFHVGLSRHTSVIAEDLRFGNAEWAESGDMVTVGRAEVHVDLWSLFRGPLLIELIDLDDTNILLLNPGDKAPNWELPIESAADDDDAQQEPGIDFLVGRIDVDRLQVHLESAERDRPLNFVVDRLDQAHRDDNYLDLELRGSLDGRAVEVDGRFGTWEALLAGKNFDIDLDAVLDTFNLSIRGRIDDAANPLRPEFEFTASGPDVDDLTRMLGLGEEGEGDINLSGSLKPVTDGPLALSIRGNVGLTEIDAVGEAADLQSFDSLRLRANASGPDLGRILRLVGIHQVRESPFMLKLDAESHDGALLVNEASMVFAEAHFDGSARIPRFPSADDAVIRLQIEGPDIQRFRYITGLPGAASGPFSLGFTVDVREDGVEVLELNAKTSLGEIHGDGRIGDPDTFIGSRVNVRVATDSIARVAAAYGLREMPDQPAELSGAADYTTAGIRTVGPVAVTMGSLVAEVDGVVALQEGIRGTDFAVKVRGGDLAQVVAMFAESTAVPALPFDVAGRLRVGNDGYRLTDASGSLGSATLTVGGLLVPADGIAGSWFDVAARGSRFEELVAPLEGLEVQPGPFEFGGRIAFRADAIALTDVKLTRAVSSARVDLTIGRGGEEARLDFGVSASGRDVRNVLNRIEGFEAFEQPFSVDARGKLRGPHWTFDRFDVAVGDATLSAAGELEFGESKRSTAFDLALDVPTLAAIGIVDGRKFRDQRLSLTAKVTGGGGRLAAEDLVMRIGSSDVHGTVLARMGEVPQVDIDVRSDRLVYLPLREEPAEDYDRAPDFDDGRLIPDIAIPFEAMRKVNASIVASIGELQRDKLYLSDIELDATLSDGALDVRSLRLKARSGGLAAKATLAPAEGQGTASLQLVGRDLAFGLLDENLDLAMTSGIDIDLRSAGTDLRALAGNASGVVYVDTRGGRLTGNQFIQKIYGDMLEEILNTINPFRKTDPYTEFECLVVPLSVTDGKIEATPSIFASTAKIRMVAQGTVNLKNEKIQLSVRSTPRRIVSFSAAELVNPYLQIVGTLASPRLAVDETGVLITGGAAVATGGLTLLARGLWDRLSKSGDPCNQMSEQALQDFAGRLPDIAIEPATREE